MARRAVLVAVAAAMVAVATLVLPSGPAAAAGCPGAAGVSVVVDFHELGGGVQSGCVAEGGGRSAAALFGSAGFPLTYVQRQPSFVCRVAGQPASDPCVNTPPADAYWGLYWSDGSSGRWTYATLGVGSQTVPDGGSVALSWIGGATRSQPGVAPAVHERTSTPEATPKPTRKPTPKPTAKPAPADKPTPPPSLTPTPTPTASPAPTRTPDASRSPKPAAGPTAATSTPPAPATSATPEPASARPTEPDDGLPVWVGPVVVGALFAAGAAVAVVRRRRDPS